MQNRGISKRELIHTVTWKQSNIQSNVLNKEIVLENVRVYTSGMFFVQSQMQTVWANFVLMWDKQHSTPLPEGRNFAVGDTIIWTGKLHQTLTITNVAPIYAESGELHHYEISLK